MIFQGKMPTENAKSPSKISFHPISEAFQIFLSFRKTFFTTFFDCSVLRHQTTTTEAESKESIQHLLQCFLRLDLSQNLFDRNVQTQKKRRERKKESSDS